MENNERIIELVRLSKLGNAHAFAELYKDIYMDLYKYALYTLNNPEDAENAVSDTVLDAYAGIGRLRDEKAFRGWIFRILSNKCNRYIREYITKRQQTDSYSVEDMAENAVAGDNSIENAENRSMIQSAFSILTDEEKQIVSMTVYGEYDSGEIAEMLRLNRNTVRSKYMRALQKMRSFLSAGGDMYGQQR